MSLKSIARIITKRRKDRRVKQEALALLIGCTRSYISKLEQGDTLPSLDLAQRLEQALGLRTGEVSKEIIKIKKMEVLLKKQAILAARSGRARPSLS